MASSLPKTAYGAATTITSFAFGTRKRRTIHIPPNSFSTFQLCNFYIIFYPTLPSHFTRVRAAGLTCGTARLCVRVRSQLKEAKQLVGHRELVRTMSLIRRSTSHPPQVWSADISGTIIVWDALVRSPPPFIHPSTIIVIIVTIIGCTTRD